MARQVSVTDTPAGTEVVAEVKKAWTDPVTLAATLLAVQGALTAFAGQGLINLIITNPDIALAVNNVVLFVAGILILVLRFFFSKNPVTLRFGE